MKQRRPEHKRVMRCIAWFVGLVSLIAVGCSPVKTIEREYYLNLPYASQSERQMVDLSVPGDVGNPPLILFIHGGGWQTEDKISAYVSVVRELFLQRGYAFASMNYRFVTEGDVFPTQIWDAKACVRYLRAHAEEYGYDGDRIGVWGTSAGGHLALLLALTQDVPELEDLSMGNAEVSSAVQACVAWYSPLDIGSIEQDYQTVFGEVSAEQRKLLQAYRSYVPTDALMEQANVLNYLSQDVPPIYLLHGTEDWVVPYLQSQRLYDALYPLVGENITLDLRKGGTHDGTDYVGKNNLSALKRVYKFLNGALRN